MKTVILSTLLTLSFSSFAQVSASPNLMSKLKIQAVLNAVTGVDEIVTGIEAADNNFFLVTIQQGECNKKELFKVTSVPSRGPAPKMAAMFVDLEDTNCR